MKDDDLSRFLYYFVKKKTKNFLTLSCKYIVATQQQPLILLGFFCRVGITVKKILINKYLF